MNLYFLVEGLTEAKVYTAWLEHYFDGKFERTKSLDDLTINSNKFYLISAGGFPSIIGNTLKSSLLDIQKSYYVNHFFICLDCDGENYEFMKFKVQEVITELGIPVSSEIHIVIQNRCIETWFLGNKRIVTTNPTNTDLQILKSHYDVRNNDPELMPTYGQLTVQAFHHKYFREVCLEKGLSYHKKNPHIVCEKPFFNALVKRVETDNHIASFGYLLNKFSTI